MVDECGYLIVRDMVGIADGSEERVIEEVV